MMLEQWPLKPLGELMNFQNGRAFKKSEWTNGIGLPIIRIQNISDSMKPFNFFNGEYKKRIEVNEGDLLFAWSATLVPHIWNGPKAVLNQHIFRIEVSEFIDKKFAYYSLLNIITEIQNKAHGAVFGHITKSNLLAMEIPVPPLEEQQRIVSILEDAFNNLADSSEQIKQKILSIDNLFDGVLESEYDNQPEWNISTLDEIIESTFYGPRFAKDAYTPDGTVSLRTTDMGDDGLFEFKDPPRIPLDAKQLEKYRLVDGDILIARSGSVGKCAIYTEDLGEAMPSAYLIRMRLKKNLVHPRFVLRYLLSRTGLSHLIGHSTSSTMANINSKNLRNIPFSFPSLAEQIRIIEKLDALHYESKTLKQTYLSGLKQLVELKQSILQDAFTGKLTGGIAA